MDAFETYETALETIGLVSRLEMTPERWEAFESAVTALATAAAAGDVAGVERATGRIGLLSHDRARSRSDPSLVQQPRRAREAAGQATESLKVRADQQRQSNGKS